MARQTISAGAPPILWSSVDEAFEKINANFTELYISMGGEGTDLSALTTGVAPAETNDLDLGSFEKRWRNIWLGGSGLNIGAANISAVDNTINLPAGSRVAGVLIKDPEDTTFNNIAVAGQDTILAASSRDTLNLSGAFIAITTDAETNTVNFTNSGVNTVSAGTGISVSGTTNVSITNSGALGVQAGLGVSVNETDQVYTVVNDGIVGLEAGTGITIGARSPITGRVVITNSAPATGIFWYRSIAVSGQSPISADTAAETLTFIAGSGIGLTTADKSGLLTDRITFSNLGVLSITGSKNITADASTGNINLTFNNQTDIVGSVYAEDSSVLVDAVNRQFLGDIKGSVFGDDSTKIVDAVENKVYAEFFGNLTGNVTGNVAGDLTGNVNGNVYGSIFTNQIESEDSSQIIIKPLTRFNSDVVIENDLTITQSLTLNGSRVINLSELKSIVAESTDFVDFQSKIAALA